MQLSTSFVKYWYIHAPSLVLVGMIYLLLARALFAMAAGWSARGSIAAVLQGVTNPVLAAVGAVTPSAIPRAGVLIFALVWLFALLFALVFALTMLGTRPLWA